MDCHEEEENCTELLFTPAIKLSQAQKRAEKFTVAKEVHKAHGELIKCIALTRIIYGNGHWRLAQAFSNLGYCYLTLQGFPAQALHHATSAENIIFRGRDSPSKSSEERGEILSTLVTIYYTLGVAHLVQKNSKKSYCSLQKAEKFMEELRESKHKDNSEPKVSERDLLEALGRASMEKKKVELAIGYFEKAVNTVILAEGETAPKLINLYKEMAQANQIRENDEEAIRHLLQAYSISLALFKKYSAEVATTALLLGKVYAATGEEKHAEAAEMYFSDSLSAYKAALGTDHPQTISALEDFSTWLGQVGKRKQAYDLLKESFKSQHDPCSDFNEQAVERLFIMGCICLAEKRLTEAFQLLSKCAEIQVIIHGPHHRKSKKIQELLVILKMLPAVRKETNHAKLKRPPVLNDSIPDL